jgi:radical SAM superfamily enzyme YgiQ (UPF0313 family)
VEQAAVLGRSRLRRTNSLVRRTHPERVGTRTLTLVNAPVSVNNPRTAFVPLPLLILGSCLKDIRDRDDQLDFDYKLLDLDLQLKQGIFPDSAGFFEQAAEAVVNEEADAYLFTTHGANLPIVIQLAGRIKARQPDAVVVLGGVTATLSAREIITHFPQIDVVIRGEGEPAMPFLVSAILKRKGFKDVPSAVYRDGGRIIENEKVFADPDAGFPFPDYSLVDLRQYVAHNKQYPYVDPGFALVESGRGCPNACSFCAPAKMWERNVRYRSIPEIIREIRFLVSQGLDFIFFTQDNLEERFIVALCNALIEEDLQIKWGCYARLDRLSYETGDLMAGSGCRLIFAGLETPNRALQRYIRKVVDSSETLKKLAYFSGKGIKFIASFIAAFQGETDVELEETLAFAIECGAGKPMHELLEGVRDADPKELLEKQANFAMVHVLTFMPGTDTYNQHRSSLRLSEYPSHHDSYGSHLFGLNDFSRRHWDKVPNAYITHLPENRVRYYYSVLRIFNFLNMRPFLFAYLLSRKKLNASLLAGFVKTLFSSPSRSLRLWRLSRQKSPLDLVRFLVREIGRNRILETSVEEFKAVFTGFMADLFGETRRWTEERK